MDITFKPKIQNDTKQTNNLGYFERVKRDFLKNKWLYLMIMPVILYYLIFKYVPMLGNIIAFMDYRPAKKILQNEWVGFKHFVEFFTSPYAWRVIRNTFMLNFQQLVFGFPIPIILALLINEVKNIYFKKTIQTFTYLPHFISIVVICGMLKDFSISTGLFNDILSYFGFERENLLANVDMFRPLYVASSIWRSAGWGSIIYLATLSGVDPTLYEASVLDGAGRFKQAIYITIPSILSVIVVMLILRIGRLMSEGFEKVILLYSPLVYEKADIISSFVYRKGLQELKYSYGTAVGLFNSIINYSLLIFANKVSRKYSEHSLW